MAIANSFVLSQGLMEHPGFRARTARERLFVILIISEFSLRGPFYQSDLEMATILKMSIAKVRQTRRFFTRRGWMKTRPGFQAKGRNLATRYLDVPCSRAKPDDSVASIHSFAFQVLLHRLRRGEFRHSDLLVYLTLEYVRLTEAEGDQYSFDITKDRLSDLTGLPGALRCVRRLHRSFRFDGGSRLFEFDNLPDRLLFTDWEEFADPSDHEEAKKEAESIQKDVKRQVQARKRQLRRQERSRNGSRGTRRPKADLAVSPDRKLRK